MSAKRISAERSIRWKALDPDRFIDPSCEARCGAHVFPHTLELHHIVPLGEVEHVHDRYLCFLCPNCHRLVHIFRRLLHGTASIDMAMDMSDWTSESDTSAAYIERIEAIARANITELEQKHGFQFRSTKEHGNN